MALKPLKPLNKIKKPLKPLREEPSTLSDIPDQGSYEGNETVRVERMGQDLARAKEANKKQREGLKELNNSNFWFAVYFQNDEQQKAFLDAMKWSQFTGGVYIDGEQLAKFMGIELPPRKRDYDVGKLDKEAQTLV